MEIQDSRGAGCTHLAPRHISDQCPQDEVQILYELCVCATFSYAYVWVVFGSIYISSHLVRFNPQ